MAAFELLGISLDEEREETFALLKERGGDLLCPIMLGPLEAIQLNCALTDPDGKEGLQMVHVFGRTLQMLGAHVASVVIDRYERGLFMACINVETPFGVTTVDARPSDALALAMSSRAPVLVAEPVLAILAQAQHDAAQRLAATRPSSVTDREPTAQDVLHELPDARPDMAGLTEAEKVVDDEGRRHHVYSGMIFSAGGEGEGAAEGTADHDAEGNAQDADAEGGLDRLEPLSRRRM